MTHEEMLWDLFKAILIADEQRLKGYGEYMHDAKTIDENARLFFKKAAVSVKAFEKETDKNE